MRPDLSQDYPIGSGSAEEWGECQQTCGAKPHERSRDVLLTSACQRHARAAQSGRAGPLGPGLASDPPKVAARGAGPAQAGGGSVLTSASRRAIFPACSPGPDPSIRPSRDATRRHGHRHTADTTRSGTDREPTDSTRCHPSLAASFSPAAVGITCQPLRWCKNPTHTPEGTLACILRTKVLKWIGKGT